MPLVPTAFDDAIKITRGSEGSRVNATGAIEWIQANKPRYQFDPIVTGRRIGIISEPSRTNIVLNNLDNSKYSIVGGALESGLGIKFLDGVSNVKKFTASGLAEWHQIKTSVLTVLPNSPYSASYFAKAGTETILRISLDGTPWTGDQDTRIAVFDLSSGTIVSGATTSNATIEKFKDGWFKCSITSATGASGGAATAAAALGSSPSTNSKDMYITGCQVEAGVGSSSLIKTLTGQVTRAADIVALSASLRLMLSIEQCTIVASYSAGYKGGSDYETVFRAYSSNVSSENSISARRFAFAPGYMEGVVVGVPQTYSAAAKPPISLPAATPARFAMARDSAGLAVSLNGGDVLKVASTIKPLPTMMLIGSAPTGQFLAGIITSIKIIPKRVSDVMLKEIQ